MTYTNDKNSRYALVRLSNVLLVFSFSLFVAFWAEAPAYSLCEAKWRLATVAECPSTDQNYTGSWAQVPDILSRIKSPVFPNRDFNIRRFGAVADGRTDCKRALSDAIAACSKAGGGRVVVPTGTYKVNGPIHLESNVNLHLEEGSKIVFGTNFADYLPVVLTRWEGTKIYNYSPLIYACQKKNIAVTGTGAIDGQAHDTWITWSKPKLARDDRTAMRRMNNEGMPLKKRVFGKGHYLRPCMIQFYECENILIEGVKILDSPFWCVHPVFSRNVTVRNLRFAAKNPNNDGIDVDSCEYVHIHDVIFDNDDDCIAIKSGRDREGRELARPTRNVVVQNCTFNAYTAIAIGSEMSGSVYNVFVENCQAMSRVKRALNIKGNRHRGGEVCHIRARNMKFLDSWEEMIAFKTAYGGTGTGGDYPPYYHDVRYESIIAQGPTPLALQIQGQPDRHIEHIIFKDITINNARKISQVSDVDGLFMQNFNINGQLQLPNADNLPPDVYAGPDQTLNPGAPGQLKGSVSDDGKPNGRLTYKWSVIQGDPKVVRIDNPNTLGTKAIFSKNGIYILRLTADDGDATGYHFTIIKVGEKPEAMTGVTS